MGAESHDIEWKRANNISMSGPIVHSELRNSGMNVIQGTMPAGVYLDPNSIAQ